MPLFLALGEVDAEGLESSRSFSVWCLRAAWARDSVKEGAEKGGERERGENVWYRLPPEEDEAYLGDEVNTYEMPLVGGSSPVAS